MFPYGWFPHGYIPLNTSLWFSPNISFLITFSIDVSLWAGYLWMYLHWYFHMIPLRQTVFLWVFLCDSPWPICFPHNLHYQWVACRCCPLALDTSLWFPLHHTFLLITFLMDVSFPMGGSLLTFYSGYSPNSFFFPSLFLLLPSFPLFLSLSSSFPLLFLFPSSLSSFL